MINFEDYCDIINLSEQNSKIDIVILFMYYDLKVNENETISLASINSYFEKSHQSKYNTTYLKKDLVKDKRVVKVKDLYKLNYKTRNDLDKHLSLYDSTNVDIRVNINSTPLLSDLDIVNANKMSRLYTILHCWENSVRKFIYKVLFKEFADSWWTNTSNSNLERKLNERKRKEESQQWVSPRGTDNFLFYLDWGDLVKIIKKHEELFKQYIPDVKFVELRLDELERLRNIIAHNGLHPEDNDIDRIIVHFNDWCSQLKNANFD